MQSNCCALFLCWHSLASDWSGLYASLCDKYPCALLLVRSRSHPIPSRPYDVSECTRAFAAMWFQMFGSRRYRCRCRYCSTNALRFVFRARHGISVNVRIGFSVCSIQIHWPTCVVIAIRCLHGWINIAHCFCSNMKSIPALIDPLFELEWSKLLTHATHHKHNRCVTL